MSEKDVASESNLASPSSRKEVLLREVLHALKQEIYLFTPLGLLSFVNRAGGDALGGALEGLTGLPWRNLPLFQGLGEPFAVAWRDLPSSDEVRSGTFFRSASGGHRRYVWTLRRLARADAVLCTMEDVSDRWGLEEALQNNEELFWDMFRQSASMMLLLDPTNGAVVDANPAALDFYGYSRDEITALHITDINRLPAEEVRAMVARVSAQHVTMTGVPHRLSDGRIRFVDVSSGPVTTRRGTVLFSIVHDISDRMVAEERLKGATVTLETLLDAMADRIFFKDAEGRYSMVNNAFLAFVGKSRDEVLGHTPREVLSGEVARFSEEGDVRALAARGPVRLENEARDPAGHAWVVEMIKMPLYQENGELRGILGMSRDITERKRTEERLRRLLNEKESLWQEVHHRVKNNLQVMASLLAIQARALPPGATEEILRKSQARIESMALLHEKVYSTGAFEGVDFGTYLQDLVQVVLQSVPEDVHPLVRFELDAANFSLDLALAVPCALLLNELVSNALRHAFSGREEGRISVSCRREMSFEGPMGVLEVQDDGVGMRNVSSSGLGLSLVELLVRQIGGVLDIVLEEGTSVRIRFPLSEPRGSGDTALPWAT